MKSISLRLSAALLTFALGAGAAWTYSSLWRSDATEPAPVSSPAEAVRVTLARSYRDKAGMIRAEFEVFNGDDEPLHYMGYGEGSNEFWSVRRGRRSSRYAPSCRTGLVGHELAPGETARFEAVLGREAGKVQVGFEFTAGEKGLRQTIWGDEVNLPEP